MNQTAQAKEPPAVYRRAMDAGWYPDPMGEEEQRYHDGQRWTDAVWGSNKPLQKTPSRPAPAAKPGDPSKGVGCGVAVAVVLLVLVLGAIINVFDGDDGGSGGNTPSGAAAPTVAYKLAVVNGKGTPIGEAEFDPLLDRIQRGTSVCKAEPDREHAADVLVASWQASSQRATLLSWTRAVVSVC